ncbi:hypothetical protein GCM10011529_07270 [Polymorphobacter glacialis]|uniref:Fe/B12 periplasmic-binding domain-containing protein n=1 Tax=Sandarakinorhabdus glacialis TaxID=1614636 RepID=A0A917E4E3_9SPHN|nr:ABC transporter substrate-binding protein [Polymorphobacter glacialis]GGE03352.1 hypothetical protein GCM10011529_07270 [Polymorphobacter glacialis]
MRVIGLALVLAGAPVEAAPRIVSINPCVDAILMHVADPGQIAGISHYSKDPRASSITVAQAARFKATSGTAEEVVALAPDIVIAGAHVAPSTIAALRRMNIALLQLGVSESLAENRVQIAQIAAAAGHVGRGARLNARIDAAVKAAHTAGSAVPALIWQGGGLVPGTETLADELLRTTGFHNLSKDYGLKRWDVLPLEHLVGRPPRVLFSVGDASGTDRMLGHRVLRPLAGHIAVREYPERLMHCGGPTIIEAVGLLARVRRSL